VAQIGDRPDDDADLRVRKHALALTMVGLIPATLLWVVIGGLIQRPLLAWASALFFGVLIVGMGIFTQTKLFSSVVRGLMISGLTYVVVGHVALGGMVSGGGAMVWGLVASVSAVLYFHTRAALGWFGAYAALVAGAVLADPWVASLTPADWSSAPLWLFAYNLLGPALIVLLLVMYVDGQRLAAQMQSRALLLDMLPASIAARLSRGERMIAETHPSTTVLFADVVNFTGLAATLSPHDLLLTLNQLFSIFDRLAARHGVEKIKTMGDSYIAVAGAPNARADHAEAAVRMAVEMHREVVRMKGLRMRNLQLRIGLASGPVIAGVIGRNRYAYDLWGETVNVAARMESYGLPGRVQLAASTRELLGDDLPLTARRLTVKGMGPMRAWVLDPDAVTGSVRPVFRARSGDEVRSPQGAGQPA
jgi:guanylate cyclase